MPKFVLVTSIGTGDSKNAPPPQVYAALEPVLVEKVKAEDRLRELCAEVGMDFGIVRPGGLKTEPRPARRCSRRTRPSAARSTARTSRRSSCSAS